MSDQFVRQSPQAVAKELGISSATLRRWSDEFADYLSREAGPGDGRNQRRYTDSDMATLVVIKELVNDGMTYEQVRQKLNGRFAMSAEPDTEQEELKDSLDNSDVTDIEEIRDVAEESAEQDENRALVTPNEEESPAIAFLTNTLTTLSDSQKSILNSQAANRELLGVLLQDNFNLKEENNRLRERILEVERNIAQSRQEDEWRREALRQELEGKIAGASQLAAEAVATARSVESPEIKAIETKPGCLGMLFGLGRTQIVTTPKRSRAEGRSRARPVGSPAAIPYHQEIPGSSPQTPHPIHPKPIIPPE